MLPFLSNNYVDSNEVQVKSFREQADKLFRNRVVKSRYCSELVIIGWLELLLAIKLEAI